MPNIFSGCGLGRRGGTVGVEVPAAMPEALGRIFELAEFDALLTALATCGQNLEEAACKLEKAPLKLLQELGLAFPDGEPLTTLASSFEACGARLQESKRHVASAQELVGAAQKKGASVREVIAARDAAWAPKLEAEKNAEVLNNRFSKTLSKDERRARLQAKDRANKEFRRLNEEAGAALGNYLDQRWQVASEILADICRSYATVFTGSQQLSGDFSLLIERLLRPGGASEPDIGSNKSVHQATRPATPEKDLESEHSSSASSTSRCRASPAAPPPPELATVTSSLHLPAARETAPAPEELVQADASSSAVPPTSMRAEPAPVASQANETAQPPGTPSACGTEEKRKPHSSEDLQTLLQDFELVRQGPDSGVQALSGVPAFSAAVARVPKALPPQPPSASAPAARQGSIGVGATGQTPDDEASALPTEKRPESSDESVAEVAAPVFTFAGLFGTVFGTVAANETEDASAPPEPPLASSVGAAAESNKASTSASSSSVPREATKTRPVQASSAAAQAAAHRPSGSSDRRVSSDEELNVSTGLRVGDKVKVLSKKKGGWVNAVVDKVFEEAGVAEGYHVPAGVIQVSFNHGIKFIRPEQVTSQLQRIAAAGGA